jgi:lactate dehydrogenase-like 2-hydroxyacid dehydrogenase
MPCCDVCCDYFSCRAVGTLKNVCGRVAHDPFPFVYFASCSINIPYIKGSPAEGGTHGIIGQEVIRHMKPDAVLLNFARGELVDSKAMKEFLDTGDGRYISDFPDDELWGHKNAILLPHLGASTEEAEDQAVSNYLR